MAWHNAHETAVAVASPAIMIEDARSAADRAVIQVEGGEMAEWQNGWSRLQSRKKRKFVNSLMAETRGGGTHVRLSPSWNKTTIAQSRIRRQFRILPISLFCQFVFQQCFHFVDFILSTFIALRYSMQLQTNATITLSETT